MTLPEDFLARIDAGYHSKIISLDYAANPEEARVTINDAVARSTHDRIRDVIPSGTITGDTKLVLTNTVYFKSVWQDPFKEENTRDDDFYNSDSKILTKMMKKTDNYSRVCVGKEFAFYDFAFKSSVLKNDSKGAYVMRIILPTVDSMNNRMKQLENVENLLSNDYTKYCTISNFDRVNISMPKFKLAPAAISLNQMLQTMGMNRAFRDNAEFYAMPNTTPKPTDFSSYLKISDILHKAFIEIDEKGGEAAAATVVVGGKLKNPAVLEPPPVYDFTVDHPFIFMIIEQSTGAAIFMGRVTDL